MEEVTLNLLKIAPVVTALNAMEVGRVRFACMLIMSGKLDFVRNFTLNMNFLEYFLLFKQYFIRYIYIYKNIKYYD